MPAICVTALKSICPIALRKPYMAFIPAALVAAGIAVLSLIEQPTVVTPIPVNDKLAHGLMYAALAVTLLVPLFRLPVNHYKSIFLTVFATTAYGLLMEALQRYCTLTRSGNMADLMADLVGALIGVTIVLVWRICTK